MNPFERGYDAFLKGKSKEDNPYDADTCPISRKGWERGWQKAQANRKVL